jgi:hypothetical protein
VGYLLLWSWTDNMISKGDFCFGSGGTYDRGLGRSQGYEEDGC